MEKEYSVVALSREYLPELEEEITASSGAGPIPDRSVDVANARPGSKIQTHFMLTDEEAEALRSDPRVRAVEIPGELRDDIKIGLNAYSRPVFNRPGGIDNTYANWALRRCIKPDNSEFGTDDILTGPYEYALDGTGVDIVIQDSGIEANHPEWEDADGNSRLQQIDWYVESGLAGTQSAGHYRDYDGHGTHVASTAAGKLYGWAKGAHIYSQKLAGLEGPGDAGTGISITDAFDAIRLWHLAKTNGRPTVVNMSWGYRYALSGDPVSGTWRGTAWAFGQYSNDRTLLWNGTGVTPAFWSGGATLLPSRDITTDAEIEDMIADGIHICVAAGNYVNKADITGGQDFNNTVLWSNGLTIPYHQGSSPYSPDAFIVGNVDSDFSATDEEPRAFSSTHGPAVNIWAPGTNIVAATSTTNDGYTTGNYAQDPTFKFTSISGTSMASPQVCGVCALHLQSKPNLTPAELKARVTNDTQSILYTYPGDADDYGSSNSLVGSENRMLYSRYGRQGLVWSGPFTL